MVVEDKIVIRKIKKSDLKNVKAFQRYINALIDEGAMIAKNKKASIKEEKDFLESCLKKSKQKIFLIITCSGMPIGIANIDQEKYVLNHIGVLGISIAKEYRGKGLGKKLMNEIIELAKKELVPTPKIIQLRVYTINKPAIALYKKLGFKQVAKLPKQIQYKGKLIDEYIMNKYL